MVDHKVDIELPVFYSTVLEFQDNDTTLGICDYSGLWFCKTYVGICKADAC